MIKLIRLFPVLFALTGLNFQSFAQSTNSDISASPKISANMTTEIATFGAGCFWCVEAVFQELNGVLSVESGYMGVKSPNPTYREVSSGQSGHAEVTQVTFDPTIISFEELLEVLWTTHDPTTLNRQEADVGTQYRSAVFYHNEDQKIKAERSKAEVATSLWTNPIVTEIVPATDFYVAETYHQDYYANNPNAGYCRIVINPKIEKVRSKFKDKLRS